MKYLSVINLIISFGLLALSACSSDDSNTANDATGDDDGTVIRQIAGTSALGRAGSWSANCLEDTCVRADVDGNYLMATEVSSSTLMWTDIPQADGSTLSYYSRYRLVAEITTSLVNLNPSTDAILDVWSRQQQNQSIDSCALTSGCVNALLASFSEDVEELMVAQFAELLSVAWPEGRNPFSDIYTADATDELDVMHDYLQYVVTADELLIYDNNSAVLTRVDHARLVRPVSLDSEQLTSTAFAAAQTIDPPTPVDNAVSMVISVSPSQPTLAPAEVQVNASRSSSPNGELDFSHDLTLASGITEEFTGATVTTTISEAGNHSWVTTGSDVAGLSRTVGTVIQLLSSVDTEPTYGGNGSCLTPASAMDANTQNLCQEVENGSSLQCDVTTSGSITLVSSPAPCAHQTQNDGNLIGVCQLLIEELRILYYENPLRLNTAESLTEKQARLADYCTGGLLGNWSLSP